MMTILLNMTLFLASGLFALLFFHRGDFYGTGGLMVSRASILYILGGIILLVGGLIRILGSEIPNQ
jgi:hypothetical protein